MEAWQLLPALGPVTVLLGSARLPSTTCKAEAQAGLCSLFLPAPMWRRPGGQVARDTWETCLEAQARVREISRRSCAWVAFLWDQGRKGHCWGQCQETLLAALTATHLKAHTCRAGPDSHLFIQHRSWASFCGLGFPLVGKMGILS